MRYLIEKVEMTEDKEHLIFHTKDNDDCGRLWSQLAGQLLDVHEGRRSIPYNLPEDSPSGTRLEIEGDTDQLFKLLTYLEDELKFYRFLAPGAVKQIHDQLNPGQLLAVKHEDGESQQDPADDDRKYSPK